MSKKFGYCKHRFCGYLVVFLSFWTPFLTKKEGSPILNPYIIRKTPPKNWPSKNPPKTLQNDSPANDPPNTRQHPQKGPKGEKTLDRASEERNEVTKVVRGHEGLLPRRPHQPPEVVGSVDNSSGRASWRCSSWNWANAVKPLPRHDHFAKWKIFSNFFTKNDLQKNDQKMIKKWPKNDPPKSRKNTIFTFTYSRDTPRTDI